jgi:hypothetical protein
MKPTTKAALAASARKALALLVSAICIHCIIDEGTDWVWVTFLLAAQWALYHTLEDLWFSDDSPAPVERPAPTPAEVVAPAPAPTPTEETPTTTFKFPQFTLHWGTPPKSSDEDKDEDKDKDDWGDDWKDEEDEKDEKDEKDELIEQLRREELISALRNLQMGNRKLCEDVADHIISENPDATLEDLIRKALRLLRRK